MNPMIGTLEIYYHQMKNGNKTKKKDKIRKTKKNNKIFFMKIYKGIIIVILYR